MSEKTRGTTRGHLELLEGEPIAKLIKGGIVLERLFMRALQILHACVLWEEGGAVVPALLLLRCREQFSDATPHGSRGVARSLENASLYRHMHMRHAQEANRDMLTGAALQSRQVRERFIKGTRNNALKRQGV
jgi:hypothetical protein